jgi:predicted nucleic acid-binding protein
MLLDSNILIYGVTEQYRGLLEPYIKNTGNAVSLGDALIAATALEQGLPLVTRNTDDFKWIAGLQLVNPFK